MKQVTKIICVYGDTNYLSMYNVFFVTLFYSFLKKLQHLSQLFFNGSFLLSLSSNFVKFNVNLWTLCFVLQKVPKSLNHWKSFEIYPVSYPFGITQNNSSDIDSAYWRFYDRWSHSLTSNHQFQFSIKWGAWLIFPAVPISQLIYWSISMFTN